VRINQHNAEAISKLNTITQVKKNLATELRTLIEVVKQYDFQNKSLVNQINQLNVSQRLRLKSVL
jgi:uncharacterized protein (DUF3084 family)